MVHMVSKYASRRFVSKAVGRPWWITGLGIGAILVYLVAAFSLGGTGIWGTPILYFGGLVGGAVAGFALGTNIYDGLIAGFRAGALAIFVVAILAIAGLFALWFSQSGQLFFYWSWFYGFSWFLVFAPVYGFFGMCSGIFGVLLRRAVVPDRMNPPRY